MNDVVSRIDAYLAKNRVEEGAKSPTEVEISADVIKNVDAIRHALSGAFGELIEVYVGTGKEAGGFFAAVPIHHLKASGLKMVETACKARHHDNDPGQILQVVIGSAEAAQNATNRVAKPLGESYKVRLDSFTCSKEPVSVYFRIDKA